MSLKSETVEAIFGRMLVRYGSVWTAKWSGVPMEAVKADWANELAGISREAIVYALGFLSLEYPPTATQFRLICGRAPERTLPALPAPARDPQKARAVANAVAGNVGLGLDKRWAHEMKAKDEAGGRITVTQRAMYRQALAA